MIWLASFPRSGNTFFRNVLYEVYGLESSTYHQEEGRDLDQAFMTYPFVKTHLLPEQLPPELSDRPSVYLVRDGRAAMVSLAHHRKDIVAPGTDFEHNLLEVIMARDNSHFGGWSHNVLQWKEKADVIIRFEDLIEDPIREVEKLRAIIDLPPPNYDKLPSFQELKFGNPQYGGTHSRKVKDDFTRKFFRKGKKDAWRSDVDQRMESFMAAHHGPMLHQMGYIDHLPETTGQYNILIDGIKMSEPFIDGIGRYTRELTNALHLLTRDLPKWNIDVIVNNNAVHLSALEDISNLSFYVEHEYEGTLIRIKEKIRQLMPGWMYNSVRSVYLGLRVRAILSFIRENVTRVKVGRFLKTRSEEGKGYDVFHAPFPQSLMSYHHLASKSLVTVHDLTHHSHSEFHLDKTQADMEEAMQLAERINAHMIAVSKYSGGLAQTLYGNDRHNVDVVHEGVRHDRFKMNMTSEMDHFIREKYSLPLCPFILCLSTIEPRKNLLNTIRAFLHLLKTNPDLKTHLVIAGKKGWMADDIYAEAKDPHIHFTGFIDDDDLPALYQMATCFSYVSYHEGFGLPLLEAMASGTPVIYGDNSAMKEIVGENGLPADPDYIQGISCQMHCLVTDEELRSVLSEKGWKRSQEFTWLKTAYHTLKVYEDIINSSDV
jgi:glycosyltransferase involved in cell wall biosynthesis